MVLLILTYRWYSNSSRFDDELLKRITTSASLKVSGNLVASLGKGQTMDLNATSIEILGDSDAEKYPIQLRNRPTLEFLREIAHLRFRTNTFGSVFRVRHSLAFAVHKFFNDKGFIYMHTPIITASDAEGAGEMFRVTTLPFDNTPKNDDGSINFKEDFLDAATNLTVSGQLEGRAWRYSIWRYLYVRPNLSCGEFKYSQTSRRVLDDRA